MQQPVEDRDGLDLVAEQLGPFWIMRLSEEDTVVLTVIPDLPATVVGVEAREKVIAEDYEQVLIPRGRRG